MSKNENLINSLNEIFHKNKISSIHPDDQELKNLFEVALTNIWATVIQQKKRESIKDEISQHFIPFFGTENIKLFVNDFCPKLEEKFPGESDYFEIYNNCLLLFEDFLKKIVDDFEIDALLLDKITISLIAIINENHENIISYLGELNKEYSIHAIQAVNTTVLAIICADFLDYSIEKVNDLAKATLLHDVAMIKIPERIFKKTEQLTEEEYNLIKSHTVNAYRLVKNNKAFNEDVINAILQHHEHFDGSGYPQKLKGEAIHEYARIISIVDAFEAQISGRAYKRKTNRYNAMRDVLSGIKKNYDPIILKTFFNSISLYPPGTLIQLNNDAIGLVYKVNNDSPLRPIVKLLISSDGVKVNGKIIVDLKEQRDLFIVYVLNKNDYNNKSINLD
jgi:HD-GYP domain-containing protein (c-di-GMP phosphodiesterase class II)